VCFIKYEKERFENATRKRNLENLICRFFKSKNISGNVVALVGNTLETHYNNWKPLLNNRSRYVVCEIEKEIHENQKIQLSKMSEKDRIELVNDDIFRFVKTYDKPIAVLDLDLCAGYTQLGNKILNCVYYCLKNKKFKQGYAGLTLTLTFRNQPSAYRNLEKLDKEIRIMALSFGYIISGTIKDSYRDKTPMIELAYIIRKDTNNKFK